MSEASNCEIGVSEKKRSNDSVGHIKEFSCPMERY